ncbi:nucleotidyltransferase family protein [Chelativorans sp.]|uniref:nucleotidyltransferase family protein n=1 Tax=Chelativorans sp. TaxID=2203393 RepID=UPI002811CFE6|nr:nucleotidyltransferase family protein [Chelativorans sp.]
MRPSEALAKHREEVLEILARYPVSNPRVFGSAARGEDTEESDLDLLVERVGPMSYFDLFTLEDELKSVLGCEVEVFTNLKPHVAASVAPELRAL